MTPDYLHDVFVSYRHADADRTWVRSRLVPRLMAGGIRVCVDYECFRPGRPIVLEMERAVLTSRYTVPVLTPTYLESTFAEFENLIATHLELEEQERHLIAVMREPCTPSLRLRYKLWVDMIDDSTFDVDAERLRKELLPGDAQ